MHQQRMALYGKSHIQCRNLILFLGHICFVLGTLFVRINFLVNCTIILAYFFFMAANVRKCIPNIKGEKDCYPFKILGATFPTNLWSFILFPIVVAVGLLVAKGEISFAAWIYILLPESLLFGFYESIATGVVFINTDSFKKGTVRYMLYVSVIFLAYYLLSVLLLVNSLVTFIAV